jgi:hypothetical protein
MSSSVVSLCDMKHVECSSKARLCMESIESAEEAYSTYTSEYRVVLSAVL